jgi:eukaryotic-like serine/threonine-protein kinase
MEQQWSMTTARWHSIAKIFEAALEKDQSERNKFVKEACAGDPGLEAEVAKLLTADEAAVSFLERLPFSTLPTPSSIDAQPSLLASGTLISGRFEILDFIGQGGMGQVYKARDLELRERVALKTIRPEISSDPSILSRFKREVQLTRRITHPNVCRTFDIERHTSAVGDGIEKDFIFLTMELLEGETLADLLRRDGRIGADAALPLVRQMVGALSAAHRVGVIHRDFKPSNVVLVPSNSGLRLVVTDFGLAHAMMLEGDASAERKGNSISGSKGLIGTLSYMAPEQLERGEATVATDVYALGLVMYEMITGRRPFASDVPFAEIFRRLKNKPAPARNHCPQLSQAWEVTIQRCLELAPESRFATAEQIVASLEKSGELSKLLSTNGTLKQNFLALLPKRGGQLLPRKVRLRLGLTIIMVALFAGSLRLYKWERRYANVAEGGGLLLAGISNQSGDADFGGVTEMLRNQLAESKYVNVMEISRIREILARMARPNDTNLDPPTAREVALRDGAPLVLFGTVSKVAEDYKLDLKLEWVGSDPRHPKNSWKFGESAVSKREFLDVVHRGGVWVRRLVGEADAEIQSADRRPEEVTTENWEALTLYAKAQKLAASNRLEDAVLVFKEAVEKDPNFAMGWMRIGDTLDTLGQSGEGFSYWRKALAVSGERRLSSREELRIKGMFANDTGDLVGAVQYFRQYSVEYPTDYLGFFYQGYPLMLLGKTEEAIAALQAAEKSAPQSYEIADHLARYSLILGDFSAAERYIARVRQLDRAENADELEGQSRFLRNDYEGARTSFSRLHSSADPYLRSVSYQLESCALAEQGRYKEAIDTLSDGVKSDLPAGDSADRADKLLAMAFLYAKQGSRRESRDAALKSLAASYSPERAAEAGSILSRTDNISDARRILRDLDASIRTRIAEVSRLRLNGEILLAQGRVDKALQVLRKAWALDQKRGLLRDYWVRVLMANEKWAEATQVVGQLLEHRGQVWHQAELYAPGAVSDLLYLQGKVAFHRKQPEANGLLSEYSERRRHADAGLREVSEVLTMLSKTKRKGE